jgi:hypothetical protein
VNWLGIVVFFAMVGALMVAAWCCGLAEAKSPIDPTIGFRDPERDYWELHRERHPDPMQAVEGSECDEARSGTGGGSTLSH